MFRKILRNPTGYSRISYNIPGDTDRFPPPSQSWKTLAPPRPASSLVSLLLRLFFLLIPDPFSSCSSSLLVRLLLRKTRQGRYDLLLDCMVLHISLIKQIPGASFLDGVVGIREASTINCLGPTRWHHSYENAFIFIICGSSIHPPTRLHR